MRPLSLNRAVAVTGLAVTLSTALFGAGYNYQKLQSLEPRVEAIEQKGSTQAQLTAKDVEWLKAKDEEVLREVREIKRLINQHMDKDAK